MEGRRNYFFQKHVIVIVVLSLSYVRIHNNDGMYCCKCLQDDLGVTKLVILHSLCSWLVCSSCLRWSGLLCIKTSLENKFQWNTHLEANLLPLFAHKMTRKVMMIVCRQSYIRTFCFVRVVLYKSQLRHINLLLLQKAFLHMKLGWSIEMLYYKS